MMIFSYDKCCVCPRDIEVYLSAVLLCLAAALPHHNIYTQNRKNRNRRRKPLSTRDSNTSIIPAASISLIPILKRPQISLPTSPRRYRYRRVIFIFSSSPPPPPQSIFNIIITNLSINLSSVDNFTSVERFPSP